MYRINARIKAVTQRGHDIFRCTFFFLVIISSSAMAEQSIELKNLAPFYIEESLRPRVYFWIDIYAKYNSWETVLHDQKYPQIVYGIAQKSDKKNNVVALKNKYKKILLFLHKNKADIEAGKKQITAEEKRIFDLFETIEGEGKFLLAADIKRIRGQAGLKDHLVQALYMSGRYLPRMEKVFQSQGLPAEIAYLPFVESGFNKKAVSKVGASGIWQFMPYTGRLFLRVDDVVDERNDPMRAAFAATRLMKQNYELLKEWPLAITAYNHGPMGIARAVKEIGSKSLAEIIEKYESPSFGFASQNFYACFLAALHVAANSTAYLGEVEKAKKLEFDEFVLPDFVSMETLIKYLDLDKKEVRELNPALTSLVYDGKKYIPVGYTLRIPIKVRDDFLAKYEKIPKELKLTQQKMEAPAETIAAPAVPAVMISEPLSSVK